MKSLDGKIMAMDYSQLEQRVVAHLSGDKVRHHNETGLRVDAACFELGNYFETEQEAEDAAKKIRAAFKNVGVDNG